ncbi:extracellular solute-binding protein [Ancrocorticia populi]|uniref:ABC transporter substrate-binding protein n=1 Tax=Ancrocorticia populi TaxID=2175228 RepID=A0A2V1KA72_9ACTO|nr:extracellular solute-binding protein [Ancrocorticia populi]PWF26557.1 hypothetical protein DD236_06825 [Ancrocorticia populi]
MTRNNHRIARVAIASFAALMLASCGSGNSSGSSSGSSSNSITIFDWGGPTGNGYEANNIRALYTTCSEELDVEFVVDEPLDYSKIRTAINSGNVPWSIVNVQNDFGTNPEELELIDYDVVDASKFTGDYAQEYRVGSDVQATVITYNQETFGSNFDSTEAFFDTDTFPGKRGVPRNLFAGLLEMALLADGVAPEDLYPLDLDRAFDKLDTIKEDLVFWDTGASSQNLIASGEVSAALVWLNRADDAIEIDGAPFEVLFDKWIQTDDYWIIPKGAPNAELANEFIECITEPEKQVDWSNNIVFGPTTTEALESPDLEDNPRRPTNHLEGQIAVDDEWWSDNYIDIAERWNAWMTE